MKKLSIFTFILLWITQLNAQTQAELHNKYWVYKDRYNQIFTQLGVLAGQSQVSNGIGRTSCGSAHLQLQNGQEVTVTQNNPYPVTLSFGDAVIDQGWYLMVLASEYWILQQEGKTETDRFQSLKNEIYFAVNAIERLDRGAEPYFDKNQNQKINGFFIRTDADHNYVEHFNDRMNDTGQLWESTPIRRVSGGNHAGPELSFVDTTGGARKVYDADSFRVNEGTSCPMRYKEGLGSQSSQSSHSNAMSQDQLYGILLGFKSILNWVDAGLTVDPDGPNGTRYQSKNIHNWVKDLTHQMMLHVSQTRTTPFPINDKDDKDIVERATNICAEFVANPYVRTDTVMLDTPIINIIINPITQDTLVNDTITFVLKDTVAPLWFPGSNLRNCNVDSIVDRLIKNTVLFKEANYVITNPADNNNLVHRGAVATPMAYALELLGESMTGHDYPSPYAKWTNTAQVIRWYSNIKWVTGATTGIDAYIDIVPFPASYLTQTRAIWGYAAILKFLAATQPETIRKLVGDESGQKTVEVLDAFPGACILTLPSADGVSTCILGKPLIVQNKDFWRDLWNQYGNSHFIKTAMKETLPINLIQNLAIASGTWNHATFKSWAEFNGKPFSEIIYANMNGHAPIKSKQHYENTLLKAQCEGTWHAGRSADGSEAPYDSIAPWYSDILFTDRGPHDGNRWERVIHGLDYMLMYNMYRMAEINHWQNDTGELSSERTQCPCKSYPSIAYTNFTPSILERKTRDDVNVYGRQYNNIEVKVPITTLISDTLQTQPIYDYYKDFNTRIPNYLLHDATLNGQTWISVPSFTPDTALGWIKVNQDLTICHSTLKLKGWGKLSIDESSNPKFPSKVIVTSGSTLEIEGLGFLEINNNTQLIIEKGATLIVHPEARIILNGPNAVLHINGKMILEPNAVFQPIAGPAGYGKVIMENNWGELYVQAKGNNKMIIDAGKADARSNGYAHSANIKSLGNYHLEARGVYGMHTGWASQGLDSFIIRNSIALISDGSQITSEAKYTRFSNAYIGGEIHQRSRGISLNVSKTRIENTTIKYVENGIEYKPLNLKAPLSLKDVDIEDCMRGVWSHGGAVQTQETQLSYGNNYPGVIGLDIHGAAGTSTLTKSTIVVPADLNPTHVWDTSNNYAEKGISYFGNSFLVLKNSEVNDGVMGIHSMDGSLRLQCSRVQSPNTYGEAQYGIIKNGGSLNLRYGYNLLTHHRYRILANRSLLSLDKGKNVINESDNPFLSVINHPKQTLAPSTLFTSSQVNTDCILATENHWRDYSTGSSSPNDFKPYPTSNNNIQILENSSFSSAAYDLGYLPFMSMTQFYPDYHSTNCPRTPAYGNVHTPDHILPDIMMPSGGGGIGTINAIYIPGICPGGINPGHNYGNALLTTVAKYNDSLVDYEVVLPELKYLSQAELPDSLFELSYYVYSVTQQAYYNSLYDTALTDSALDIRNAVFGDSMLAFQNQLIERHDNNALFWKDISYELGRDKALVLRSLNRRPEALTVLSNLMNEVSDTLYVKQAQAWSCFIEQEQMVLDSLISIDSLNFNLCVNEADFIPDTFINSGSNPTFTHARILERKNTVLYPNPAENGFYLKANRALLKGQIQMFDAFGRQVQVSVVKLSEQQLFIDALGLKSGMYTLILSNEGEKKRETFKVTILR